MAFSVSTRFEDSSKEALRKISQKTIEGLEEVGKVVLPASKAAVPVDEGDLLRSIDYRIERQSGALRAGGPGARHANLVEYGTHKMAPQSFLRAPVERLKRTIQAVMARKQKESR